MPILQLPELWLPSKPAIIRPAKLREATAFAFGGSGGKGPFSMTPIGSTGFFASGASSSSVNIATGITNPNQCIVVGVTLSVSSSGSFATGVSGASINGVAATIASSGFSSGLANDGSVVIIAKVSTGGTVNVTVNWTGSGSLAGVSDAYVWSLKNVNSIAPDSGAGQGGQNAAVLTINPTIQNKGAAVYVCGSHPVTSTGSLVISAAGYTQRINTNNGAQDLFAAGDNSNTSGSPTAPGVTFQRIGASAATISACGASWH